MDSSEKQNSSFSDIFHMGIDIGSTTSKAVLKDRRFETVFSVYKRHHGKILQNVSEMVSEASGYSGDSKVAFTITGSAGMGIAEKYNLNFEQELIAAAEYIGALKPEIQTLIDIGGEDSKIVFFDDINGPHIRMNSNCAGGTGAFIDQMCSILRISIAELNEYASNAKRALPIASRCGVFAKTDVQNLVSNKVSLEDISASILYAISLQIKNTLLRGDRILPSLAFSGGPLTFIPELKRILAEVLEIHSENITALENPALLTAEGAALCMPVKTSIYSCSEMLRLIEERKLNYISTTNSLEKLFDNEKEFNSWKERNNSNHTPTSSLKVSRKSNVFLGIDSGSTTTKIVLIDERNRILFKYYANNTSDPIKTVSEGLKELEEKARNENIELKISSSAATGYGENLIKAAYNLDYGFVETMAHYRSASVFDKDVSFILDIGGQDMKAIFVDNGIIRNIDINEACSSGCGSFIETFANAMDYSVADFASSACDAKYPCDLGTRCTVFMNSKVKQAFRKGASVGDISAGLAYSVVNNCIRKVLNISDVSKFGDNIVVQGGTFKNPAVQRAFEKILGKPVTRPDISELMGAYGAALLAKDNDNSRGRPARLITEISSGSKYRSREISCKGCENNCSVQRINFENGNKYYTGNRCEKKFNNFAQKKQSGENFISTKYKLLFNHKLKPEKENPLRIGIPRVLNMYENYPFWAKLFAGCGFETVLSDDSTSSLSDAGSGSIMSDNICFPAKLVHGHIENLAQKKVDRIFYPIVTFEKQENKYSSNSFNCPVVSGYPDVIRRVMNPQKKYHIPYDTINVSFKDNNLLKKSCFEYFRLLGVDKKIFNKAFNAALEYYEKIRNKIGRAGQQVIKNNVGSGKLLFVLAGRPYHCDRLINHDIPDMIAQMGADVITEDIIPIDEEKLKDIGVINQWVYPNRILNAAKWAAGLENTRLIQLNSFGCGPDTIICDEVKDTMREYGKTPTIIRIDESTSPGSLKLRIRSLIESVRLNSRGKNVKIKKFKRRNVKYFDKEDKGRTILAPFFSEFHNAYMANPFAELGYKVEMLPEPDRYSTELGLKYVNNEICYPATIVIGDILKALKSGRYDPDKIAVGITQTGGQCRASNYVPLLKKAMLRAGFDNVPVVSVSLAKAKLNYQPGFRLKKRTVVVQGILGLLFGDILANMYYSTAPREMVKGDSKQLVQKYNSLVTNIRARNKKKYLLETLEQAVEDFNNVNVIRDQVPKIGVVGEVYVKNSPFGNNFTVNYLLDKGVEVVMPPLINMFIQWFVNIKIKNKLHIDKRIIAEKATYFLEKYYNRVHRQFDEIARGFRYYFRHPSINEIAEKAEPLINMIHHYFGEGWMIAGDMAYYAENGVHNILCLQPFGCLANHIVARGIEKAVKDKYSFLNVQYIDLDHGMSDVNIHNRIELLLRRKNGALKVEETENINKIIP